MKIIFLIILGVAVSVIGASVFLSDTLMESANLSAFSPKLFYDEEKTSHRTTPEERRLVDAEIQKWEQQIPGWPLVSQFVEKNPFYHIELNLEGLKMAGKVKSNVYSLENDLVKELEVTYDYDKEEFAYGYACYELLGTTIVIEKSKVISMTDIENQDCLEFSERPPQQYSGPSSNEKSFKRSAIRDLIHQEFLDDPLVSQFIEENPRYKTRVDSSNLYNTGIKQGFVYSFEHDFIKELKVTLENSPEKSAYWYMCYNPGENEWGEESIVHSIEDIKKQECLEMSKNSPFRSPELRNLDGSVKTETEILVSKQVILDDPLVSQFIEENPRYNMVLRNGTFEGGGRVQYEIFTWEDDLIKKLEILHRDSSGELIYHYTCYTPGENVGRFEYRVYDMDDIENQECYETPR